MLGLMRKHATSWLIKVFLFAIVIVFIFWGGYSYTERRASRVAVVNDSYIGIQEYRNAYNNLLDQMRRQLGNQFSADILETLNLKEQALNQLINRRLLLEGWIGADGPLKLFSGNVQLHSSRLFQKQSTVDQLIQSLIF